VSDAVITAALQAIPTGGAAITMLVLLLRHVASSNTTHQQQRAEWAAEKAQARLDSADERSKWDEERDRHKNEIKNQELTIDRLLEMKRDVEEEFAKYRREHP
jgi:uncharacterized membrane protein